MPHATPEGTPQRPRLNPEDDALRVGKPSHVSAQAIRIDARPQPLWIDPASTALIVVDMQNAYASSGGYMDRAGFDISDTSDTVQGVRRAIAAARRAGVQILYLQNGWDAAYQEAGGPGSPNWHKSNALRTMRAQPDLDGSLLSKGGWDHALLDAVKPAPDDIVVLKTRYSGFFNSTLDSMLRSRGIRTLLFSGIATNVCVESTLRDGYHLEYFCVLLDDATTQAGPAFTRQATLYNVETFFGWISDVDRALGALPAGAATTGAPADA